MSYPVAIAATVWWIVFVLIFSADSDSAEMAT
jgi:hypothetical protein